MPLTIYSDGSKYGDADAIYGRISSDLAAAQVSRIRETGLKVSVINQHLNAWEYFTGAANDMTLDFFWRVNGHTPNPSQDYYSYRGLSSMCKLGNGHIIRVRNGNPADVNDRQIWVQEITDPLVAAQWNSWSVLYSGTHYGCQVIPDTSSTYIVYHPKSDGFYRNNVKMLDNSLLNDAGSRFMAGFPVVGAKDALFITGLKDDLIDGGGKRRTMDLYYTSDVTAGWINSDQTNYRWSRNGVKSFLMPDGRIGRIQSNSWYFDPRRADQGNALTVAFCQDIDAGDTPEPPYLIRGIGGGTGHNYAVPGALVQLSDGFYYFFCSEVHRDQDFEDTANIPSPGVWQRSKDLIYWSEPIALGFTVYGGIEVVEHSGYVWLAGNGSVYRRPLAVTTYDLSNYVPSLEFEIPRDNQPATGMVTVANPDGINDAIKNLSDREIKIEIGLKTAAGYEFIEMNKWFVGKVDQAIENPGNRLQIPFGDLWNRLDNPFRDTINIVGQIEWKDWAQGRRNKAFNYFFTADSAPVETSAFRLRTKGIVLYTGWKGQNADISAHFSVVTGNPSIIFRYVDAKNYFRVEKSGTSLNLYQKSDGVDSLEATGTCSSDTSPTMRVRFTWGFIEAWVNGAAILFHTINDPVNVKPGYVGFKSTKYDVSDFTLDEWEQPVTTAELVKRALAAGDFHDVQILSGSSRQLAIIWGPQTDLPSPAAALAQALNSDKLELVWREGVVSVGKFTDPSVYKVIQDEVIEYSRVDEAIRRVNFVSVDGNEHNWMQFDAADIQSRDRQINSYLDLPELMTQDAVTLRAQEELRRSKQGASPGVKVPLFLDLWRMDVISVIDLLGNTETARIEGMKISINQGTQPRQDQELDTSLVQGDSGSFIE